MKGRAIARRRRTATDDLAQEVAKAHTDLNIFYAIIAILEGGTISSESHDVAAEIIDLCKHHGHDCLKRFDTARAALTQSKGSQS